MCSSSVSCTIFFIVVVIFIIFVITLVMMIGVVMTWHRTCRCPVRGCFFRPKHA